METKSFFEVGTLRISQLFHNSEVNLTIPEYQRPYVWSENQIEEMLLDWEDHFFENKVLKSDAVEYYLGAIMIYENEGKFEIIDGQQRLTTLLIMDYVWNHDKPVLAEKKLNFEYKSKISFNTIKKNQKFLASQKSCLGALKFNDIISKLVVSVIITNSEDRAFVLFDSQNNRGVALDEVDFFKSYHLRELNKHENYLKYFAKKFDSINALNQSKSHKNKHLKSLNELFVKQLWTIRFWSRNQLYFPKRKSLLETFQKKTVSYSNVKVDEIKLFPSFNNSLGTSLVYNEQMKPELNSKIKLFGAESIDIPFTINQPIQKGIGFFLYTEKYTSIFNYIFREGKITELEPITNLIYRVFNSFFIDLYQLAIVQYFDKFNTEKIEEFAKRFEHYLGAYRMNRSSIVEQSPIVLLRDFGNVLMDIQQAYLVTDVLDALKRYVPENFYDGYKYKTTEDDIFIQFNNNNNQNLTAARQNYYKLVRLFYKDYVNTNYQLTEKHNWINESITK